MSSRKRNEALGEIEHAAIHDGFAEKLDDAGCSFGRVISANLNNLCLAVNNYDLAVTTIHADVGKIRELTRDTMGVASAAKALVESMIEANDKFKESIQRQWNALWIQILIGVILGNSTVFGLMYFLVETRR